jgi:hypothetical protein
MGRTKIALYPVDSRDRNPTDKSPINENVSKDYLVLANNTYGSGCYSYATKRWLITQWFDKTVDGYYSPNTEYIKENVIWYQETEIG